MSNLRVTVTSGPAIAVYPPGATFGPRPMVDYEFVWIVEGHAKYVRSKAGNHEEVEMPQGSMVLCMPGYEDSFLWAADHRTRHGFFHFRVEESDPLWGSPQTWPVFRTFEESGLFATLMAHMMATSSELASAQKNLSAALMLGAFISGESGVSRLPHHRPPDAVERALEFIYARLEETPDAQLDLETIARAAFVTPEHLCRIFKKATGHSPLETVRLARLDRAAVLLTRSNFGVAEVARLTGFASPFHFSRAFKAAYQVSPREMQKAAASGELTPLPRLLKTWN